MRGLHINEMTKTARGGGGSTRIRVDTREFNMAMKDAEKVIAKAMFEGSGAAFDQTKRETDRYLRSLTYQTPQAKKVADSLDYSKRGERKPEIRGDDITLEAMFGSRGPHIRGEIGVGVHTSPDDNGGTFNIGQAVEEGISARTFSWRSAGATEHSRQIGRKGSATAWFAGKGSGQAEFKGIQGTEYISHAANFFNRRIKTEVERRLEF